MSFLDELDQPDICEFSLCPRCKDDPAAIEHRRAQLEAATQRMKRPLREVLAELLAVRPARTPAVVE